MNTIIELKQAIKMIGACITIIYKKEVFFCFHWKRYNKVKLGP